MNIILLSISRLKKDWNQTIHILQALSKTIESVLGFFHALFSWFGFAPFVLLLFLVFVYRFLSSIVPSAVRTNWTLAILTVTSVWLTWNHHFYHEWRLASIFRNYAILASILLPVLFLQTGIPYLLRLLRKRNKASDRAFHVTAESSDQKPTDLLSLYEDLDRIQISLKQNLRAQNAEAAHALLERMKDDVEEYFSQNSR